MISRSVLTVVECGDNGYSCRAQYHPRYMSDENQYARRMDQSVKRSTVYIRTLFSHRNNEHGFSVMTRAAGGQGKKPSDPVCKACGYSGRCAVYAGLIYRLSVVESDAATCAVAAVIMEGSGAGCRGATAWDASVLAVEMSVAPSLAGVLVVCVVSWVYCFLVVC